MKILNCILIFGLVAIRSGAQTTAEQVVTAVLQAHPLQRAASQEVQAKRYAEKAAFKLPNPELNAESPTGEFYTLGVLQSFAFPTVYRRQKAVAKANTALAGASLQLTENELRYAARGFYLDAQAGRMLAAQWALRDSMYRQIAASAARQFAAGEIDLLQKNVLENEAGKVRQERMAAEQNAAMLQQQLARFAGLSDIQLLTPLVADTVAWLTRLSQGDVAENPALAFEKQSVLVAEEETRLAKSQALPGFSIGYLNQGPRNTPMDYRFRASMDIPLWAGQYKAGVHSAKAATLAATARAEAQERSLAMELERSRSEAATALHQIHYYEQEALPRSKTMMATAIRLREAGQTDYVTFLRTLDEAYSIQAEYTAQIQAFEAARIRLLYLLGQ